MKFKSGDKVGFANDFGLSGVVALVDTDGVVVKWVRKDGGWFHASYSWEEVNKWGVVKV